MIHTKNIKEQIFINFRGQFLGLKSIFCTLLILCLFNCSENPENYIEHIEGYWEIEEVTLSNGTKKKYKYNETVDYIQLNDSLKGFRKKLTPGINDVYFTSDDAEALTLKIKNNQLQIYYSTPYAEWKETVLEASPSRLKVSNENKDVYLYKRYTPINLDIE